MTIKNKYRVRSLIGEGGMGSVYAGEVIGADGFQKEVAIKVRKRDGRTQERRFLNEARLWSKLAHPNIVQVLDFDRTEDGRLFLVMERVEGVNLDDLPKPLAPNIVHYVLDGVLSALVAASNKRIIHRDISLDNILIDRHGMVKLTDFGIAQELSEAKFKTDPGYVVGKVPFLSPEQVDNRKLDARTDLFSLGVVAYHLLTGKSPWGVHNQSTAVMVRIRTVRPFDLRLASPKISEKLATFCERLIEKERRYRFRSAAEAQAALRNIERPDASEDLSSRVTEALAQKILHPVESIDIDGRNKHQKSWAVYLHPRPLMAWAGAIIMIGMLAGVSLGHITKQEDSSKLDLHDGDVSAPEVVAQVLFSAEPGSDAAESNVSCTIGDVVNQERSNGDIRHKTSNRLRPNIGVRVLEDPSGQVTTALGKALRPSKRRIARCFSAISLRSEGVTIRLGIVLLPGGTTQSMVQPDNSSGRRFMRCVLQNVPHLARVPPGVRMLRIQELIVSTEKGDLHEGFMDL